MLKVLVVFGTRPEAIKMAPLIRQLHLHKDQVKTIVCVTAQHRQMLDPFLKHFGIRPDDDLNIMRKGQSLEYITSQVITQISRVIDKRKPDYLIIQGDTSTSLAACLAAFYKKVKIAHVEAGLRTYDLQRPFPEEANRCLIDQLSDLFFVHSRQAKENLVREGKPACRIEVTGNTVVDAIMQEAGRKAAFKQTMLAKLISQHKKILLVTAHRRENLGAPLENICKGLVKLAKHYQKDINIIYPVHLNPAVKGKVHKLLGGKPNIHLVPPLDYFSFIHLMKASYFILSDSGGIQEEAPSLHKPVLVLRDVTERPEALRAGVTRLVGTDPQRIFQEASLLLEDPRAYQAMARAPNPYGDGKASERIVKRLLNPG